MNDSKGPPISEQSTPDQILSLGLAFWGSKTLLSAVEIGLFTELANKGSLDFETLAERLMLHPRSATDFLDALVALGMLERDGDQYANTPETDLFLDRAKPSYVGGLLEMANARLYPFWGSLTEALRIGQLQNEAKGGEEDFFATIYADPGRLEGFLKAMTGISLGTAIAIASKFPWDHYETLVDVGTAQGGLPVQVALSHEHLSGGGFDLPPVGPIFEQYVDSHGLGGRLRFYPGDFFESLAYLQGIEAMSAESVWHEFSPDVRVHWALCKRAIEKQREEEADPILYEEFERLSRLMADMDRERGSPDPTPE